MVCSFVAVRCWDVRVLELLVFVQGDGRKIEVLWFWLVGWLIVDGENGNMK